MHLILCYPLKKDNKDNMLDQEIFENLEVALMQLESIVEELGDV